MSILVPKESDDTRLKRAISAQLFLKTDPNSEEASVFWAEQSPRSSPTRREIGSALPVAASSITSGSVMVVNTAVVLGSEGDSVRVADRSLGIWLVTLPDPTELARAKLAAAKARHFKPEGKDERVRKALAALRSIPLDSGLDADTLRWIAEDADVEYMEDGRE